jgi:urease accessory protein
MLQLHELVPPTETARASSTTATLTLDDRRRSRLRFLLDDGREAGLFLPRGSALRDGDCLRGTTGEIVLVRAAPELLSVARAGDPHTLLRGAYHLGNRHVPLQLGEGWLAYEHDHVLDAMVRGLGLDVESRRLPFEPEGGAFGHDGGGEAAHGHAHTHAEGGRHGHDHHGAPHRHA